VAATIEGEGRPAAAAAALCEVEGQQAAVAARVGFSVRFFYNLRDLVGEETGARDPFSERVRVVEWGHGRAQLPYYP
jgi:hypothetical protein